MTVDWARPRDYVAPFPTAYDAAGSGEIRSGGDEVVMDYWQPGRNLANARAAYLPAEDALLVLDVEDGGDAVRLLRVPIAGGSVVQINGWSRTLSNTTFAMTALDDGLGYAIACTDASGAHTVLRIAANGELESYSKASGPLLSTMIGAREIGVTVLVDTGAPTPAGHAHNAFSTAGASTPELCF